MKSALAFCLALLATTPSWAENAPIQIGDHRNLGRVVVSLGSVAPAIVRQHGTRIDVSVAAGEDVAAPDNVPRNVLSIVGGHGSARLTVVSGAKLKSKQEGRTLVIDVLDPASRSRSAAATTGSRPNPGKPPTPPESVVSITAPAVIQPIAEPKASEAASPRPEPEKSAERVEVHPSAPVTTPEPVATSSPVSPPRPVTRSFTLRASAETGVAAFRHGDLGIIVTDDDVALADAEEPTSLTPIVQSIQHGTLLKVALADDEALKLVRSEGALTVTIAASTGSAASMKAVPAGVQFQFAKPGRVMVISDPVSGQTMLIGTTRQTDGEHARVEASRSAPGYRLLPTWLGIAVDVSADEIDLKASTSGYTLAVADKAATNATAAARHENQFGIPVAPTDVLVRQMNAQIASAAAAPVRARGPDRVAAARTMLALGMSAEAEALLTLAATDDPAVARDPAVTALTGIAAVLAGRPADAMGLDNPALSTNGDIALWRGLRDAAEARAAPALAGAWPLLPAYPDAIRARIAPAVMESAAVNGADVPTADMAGQSLALARALKLAHDGKNDDAMAALIGVRDSRDEWASVQAAIALAELRLRLGQRSPADTAEQLERQTVRWRGGVLELSLRLRSAQLRTESNQWRVALEGLRDAQGLFPDAKGRIEQARADVFRALLDRGAASVTPLELVLIAGEFADGLSDQEAGDMLAGMLAEKLAALDLPARARPVLQHLMDKAATETAKSEYGLRLARVQLDSGDAPAAEALLSSLDLNGLPAVREGQRTILLARAKAAREDFAGAAATLLTLSTPEADDMRANFYARAGDWQRSLETLEASAAARVPETGALDEEQQDLILREATAAVQAGDGDALKKLSRFENRITAPRADLFHVMTASAVRSPSDLPRAARELAMSKTLPDRLNALRIR